MKKLLLAVALVAFSTIAAADGQNGGLGINGQLDLSGFAGHGAVSNSAVAGGIVGRGTTWGQVSSRASNVSTAFSKTCFTCRPRCQTAFNKTTSLSTGGAKVNLVGPKNSIDGEALYAANGTAISGYGLQGDLSVYGEFGVIDAAHTGINYGSVTD